jgi:flagellar protein FliT
MNILTLYEAMSEISTRMVMAARASDWTGLVALERDVAGLREKLDNGAFRPALSAEDRARKLALIRRILADDAEVRRHTEPWMESVRRFLGNTALDNPPRSGPPAVR